MTNRIKFKNINCLFYIYFSLVIALGATTMGCNNTGKSGEASSASNRGAVSGTSTTRTPNTGPTTSAVTATSFTMVNAVVTDVNTDAGNTTPPNFTLMFNADNAAQSLNDFCQVQSATGGNNNPAKACRCHYEWTEINSSDTSSFLRTIETEPTQITAFEVRCPAPDVYNTEIADNTILKITVVPNVPAGNTSSFTTTALNYTKKAVTSVGDFRDSEGRSYRNIFHYVCHDKPQRSPGIEQITKTAFTNPDTNQPVYAKVANNFRMIAGSAGASPFSGQSYYYDFYVRSNETGSINSGSSSFNCPLVNINSNPSYYPMDSVFALALQKSKDFPITVSASTFIPLGGSGAAQAGDVLGYAAKPNADGTCPSFTNSAGRILRTYRLRQFTALYPIRYGADGDLLDTQQPFNVLYLLDRPVDKLGQDPLKPMTRLGPKPCPFSMKTAQFGQKCTTDASLAGWNIDGTQVEPDPGCPIYPPVDPKYLKADGTLVIRPFKPFLPHYLENTSVKACAFESTTRVDPEIVLSHDDTIYPGTAGPFDFYCAKHYPPAGAIIPPPNGDPFDKAPGDCDLGGVGAALKTDKTYACARTFDPTNSSLVNPRAGCCQICSGPDCTAQGGGTVAAGRNAVFSPPANVGNPPQAVKMLNRAVPNKVGETGCFDPFED